MKVIGKTESGFLIEATETEIKEILGSVTGTKPSVIEIGVKIPAIDYAGTITKIKGLADNPYFRSLTTSFDSFSKEFNNLVDKVKESNKIEN